MKIVLDTNVLVSGLLSPAGPPGRILDLAISLHVTVVFDDRILAEYREVLARPRLRIAPAEAAAVLDLIEKEGLLVSAPPLGLELPDPDDLPFVEVAEAGAAAALVTGNARHFAPLRGTFSVPILTPAAFLERWAAWEHGTGS
ncbi:MAG TPA: putative toxin-antitoxin system toxin component, PIN family [Longimicrobium sp.]|nr:putative toxin-antitoxin system toxin component, PIN family [Longimicrobium sp.]